MIHSSFKMSPTVICFLCEKEFSKSSNLNRHLKEVHNYNYQVTKNKELNNHFKCVICNECCESFKHFSKHVFEKHEIVIEKENFQFSNPDEFYNWKSITEDLNNSFFTKHRTCQAPKNCSTVDFSCNRSGFYKPKVQESERERKLKLHGSSKIEGYCPASIKAIFKEDGLVLVEYTSTHVGHNTELAHLHLKLEQRKNIADKIAKKIPFDEILVEIKSSVEKNEIKREHLITKHDLYNIEKEFSLNKDTSNYFNDLERIDAWVKKEKASDNNCILVYKPQGVIFEDYPSLELEDFALGIMTDAQVEILRKFSSDCIIVDSMYGSSAFDFKMTTLMVIDDTKQSFLCAFYISNRSDEESIQIFFNAVKFHVGIITSKIFMSDVTDYFYKAWEGIMGVTNNKLFCTWHVDKDWRKNLTKIKKIDEQKMTYKKIKALLDESDKEAFQPMLKSIAQELNNDVITKDFGEYFYKSYVHCYECWANSYRTNLGLDTNLNLERMHKTIKYLYLKSKHIKSLDQAVRAIMQMVKNKLVDRLIILKKGKITSKLKDLQIRHKEAVKLKPDLVISNGKGCWKVMSSSNNFDVYSVRKVGLINDCECLLICKHCLTCIHSYSCTCLDSCIKWNMCKHIHLVCRVVNLDLATTDNVPVQSNDQNIHKTSFINMEVDGETPTILSDMKFDSDVDQIDVQKQLLKDKIELLLNSVSTYEEVQVFHEIIDTLVPKLKALKENMEVKKDNCVVPSNKNIQPQSRLSRKRKKSETIRK